MVQKLKNDKNRDDSLLFSWAHIWWFCTCAVNSASRGFFATARLSCFITQGSQVVYITKSAVGMCICMCVGMSKWPATECFPAHSDYCTNCSSIPFDYSFSVIV